MCWDYAHGDEHALGVVDVKAHLVMRRKNGPWHGALRCLGRTLVRRILCTLIAVRGSRGMVTWFRDTEFLGRALGKGLVCRSGWDRE